MTRLGAWASWGKRRLARAALSAKRSGVSGQAAEQAAFGAP
jgi:hypothetical protein